MNGALRSTSHGILRSTELIISLLEIKNDIFMICVVSVAWSEVCALVCHMRLTDAMSKRFTVHLSAVACGNVPKYLSYGRL